MPRMANGLRTHHAYAVLDVVEDTELLALPRTCKETSDKGDMVRLVQIRSPWGIGEWQGAWSDLPGESSSWSEQWQENPELRKRLAVRRRRDGASYMAFQDLSEL